MAPNRLAHAVERLRAGGRPFIDLTQSNPTRADIAYPSDLLAALGNPRALTYDPCPFGAIDARRAVAREYVRQGLHVPAERIVLTASTSEAYSLLFKLLADAGDEVLVPRPSYPLFDHLTRLELVVARPYDLEYHGAWTIDMASVDAALTTRTRTILVVSPNNPTSSVISRVELDELASRCAARGLAIIADEVFADYELRPGALAGAARSTTRSDILSFALGGLSKTIGLPQVKLGWIAVAGPDRMVAEALERLELICDTYLSVSTPVQAAAADLLACGAPVREQIATRVAENYRWLESALVHSPCSVLRADAGWYAVVQVPTLEPEEDLVVRLATTDGVLAHPGYFFDFGRESFLVVSLLPPRDTFAEGITRVVRHFTCSGGAP
jgi:aspartate/methionine/tyrosine aminotransferase